MYIQRSERCMYNVLEPRVSNVFGRCTYVPNILEGVGGTHTVQRPGKEDLGLRRGLCDCVTGTGPSVSVCWDTRCGAPLMRPDEGYSDFPVQRECGGSPNPRPLESGGSGVNSIAEVVNGGLSVGDSHQDLYRCSTAYLYPLPFHYPLPNVRIL